MEKIKNIFKKNEIYLFLLLIIFYGVWKFYPSLTIGNTVSFPHGDGLATIAWFGEVSEQFKIQKMSYFFSDLVSVELLGNGVYEPIPMNGLQKIIITTLSLIVYSDNIYDVYAMIGFILVGISSFVLLKEIDTLPVFAVMGALIIINSSNYIRYPGGHLSLGMPFIPILLTLFIIRAAKIISYKNILLIVVLTVLNFMMNEYYGFYGVFFTIFLFFGLIIYYHTEAIKTKAFWIGMVKKISIAAVVFIVLMSMAYPNMFFQKIVSIFIHTATTVSSSFGSRSFEEFIAFSIKNHWYYFYPKIPLLQNLVSSEFFTRDVFWEQSFRIGLVLPILFILSYLFVFFKRNLLGLEKRNSLWFGLALAPAIIIMFLFSNDPNYGPSLVKVSYSLSEIFRVGARAYLYIFILSLVLFFFYFNLAWQLLSKQNKIKNLTLYFFALALFVSALFDVTGNLWRSQVASYKLPSNDVYTHLATLPKGLVCEIPFYSLPQDVPESSYIYAYNRSIYKAPLLNAQVPMTNKYYTAYNALSTLMKNPDSATIGLLRDIGVRYVVVDSNNSQWNHEVITKQFVMLKTNREKTLYQIKGFNPKTPEETRMLLLNKSTELLHKALLKKMEIAPELKLSECIDLTKEKSRAFLLSGFSQTESWGTWMDDKEAVILFRADNELINKAKYLEISFKIFTDGKYMQEIQFKLNGKMIKKGAFSKQKNTNISILIRDRLKEQNILVIEAPMAISPKELNVGSDTRKLSIGMINLQFN